MAAKTTQAVTAQPVLNALASAKVAKTKSKAGTRTKTPQDMVGAEKDKRTILTLYPSHQRTVLFLPRFNSRVSVKGYWQGGAIASGERSRFEVLPFPPRFFPGGQRLSF